MIAFVDKPPLIQPHGEGFLATFQSGDQQLQPMLLTRHALTGMEAAIRGARAKAAVADLDKEPIRFSKRRPKC